MTARAHTLMQCFCACCPLPSHMGSQKTTRSVLGLLSRAQAHRAWNMNFCLVSMQQTCFPATLACMLARHVTSLLGAARHACCAIMACGSQTFDPPSADCLRPLQKGIHCAGTRLRDLIDAATPPLPSRQGPAAAAAHTGWPLAQTPPLALSHRTAACPRLSA